MAGCRNDSLPFFVVKTLPIYGHFCLGHLFLIPFGILFLTAGRMVDDCKTHRRDLFMAAPIGKDQRKIHGELFICSHIDVCAVDFIVDWFYFI